VKGSLRDILSGNGHLEFKGAPEINAEGVDVPRIKDIGLTLIATSLATMTVHIRVAQWNGKDVFFLLEHMDFEYRAELFELLEIV
jgi:hypothetical protein